MTLRELKARIDEQIEAAIEKYGDQPAYVTCDGDLGIRFANDDNEIYLDLG